MDELMTPERVAERLHLPLETVLGLIRDGQLGAAMTGAGCRVSRKDFDAFLIAHAGRPEVQDVLFDRLLAIGARNPGVDGDALLEELEREDEERKRLRRATS